MKFNRRKFLWSSVAVAGVVAVGVWEVGPKAMESGIVSVLKRRLGYLKLDEPGLHAYARDQVAAVLHKRFPTLNRWRYHFLSATAPSFMRYYRSSDTRSKRIRAEDSLVSTYLLSSDFFINGADESKTVQYLAFFDPVRGCGNPFARPAVPS